VGLIGLRKVEVDDIAVYMIKWMRLPRAIGQHVEH
jgi:hypothetical protein